MDLAHFFQEATLRICSTLELNKALDALLEYIKNYLPVKDISFILTSENMSTISVVESTDLAQKTTAENTNIVFDQDIKTFLKQMWVSYANNIAELTQLSHLESNALLEETSSTTLWSLPFAILRMVIDDKPSGALLFHGIEGSEFTENDMELLKQLHAPCALAVNNCLRFQETLKLKQRLSSENLELQERMEALTHLEVIGAKTGLRDIMDLVQHVAPLSTPVFIQGESGTGKEVIARSIHQLSTRKDMPFIAVNCGALNSQLIESELFGHEKGAFTNAIRAHKGVFERANNGTLFLDEICELPLESQTKLLRVLQLYEIQRVGGNKSISVDTRIISATNKDLKKAMQSGLLREDLYYRLAVFPITLPPLREHAEDIPALINYFLRKKAAHMHRKVPQVSSDVMDKLIHYPWHGNVRELENFIERALVLSPADRLLIYSDSEILQHSSSDEGENTVRLATLKEIEEEHIRRMLEHTHGKITGKNGAATILDMNRFTLYRRLDEFGIKYGRKVKE